MHDHQQNQLKVIKDWAIKDLQFQFTDLPAQNEVG